MRRLVSAEPSVTIGSEEAIASSQTKYYYAGGKRIAMRRNSTLTYIFTDHLGGTSVTLNASNNQVDRITFYPFGGTRTGSVPTDYKFTGQRADSGTGLYDYGARQYDPALGRFISPDSLVSNPTDPQELNRYSYALGNPVRYTDPSGHFVPINDTSDRVIDISDWPELLKGLAIIGSLFLPYHVNSENGEIVSTWQERAEYRINSLMSAGVNGAARPGQSLASKLLGRIFSRAEGEAAGQGVIRAAESAERKVLDEGLAGSFERAMQEATGKPEALRGLFKYTDAAAKTISGYQKHHLWPEAMGGPHEGWTIYVKNYHTSENQIQYRLNYYLQQQLKMDQAQLEAWARQNPDKILPYLRQFYSDNGIAFPY